MESGITNRTHPRRPEEREYALGQLPNTKVLRLRFFDMRTKA